MNCELCFKKVFEIAISCCHSVVNGNSCVLQLLLTDPVPAGSQFHIVTCIAQLTGGCSQQLKSTHNA
jgi:hypothetical protein